MKHYAYQRVIRDYNNANYGLNNDLTGTNWEEEVFNAENINEINSNFTNIITSCNKKRIPTKVITIRPRDKAFKSNFIRKFMRKRNRKHRKAAKTQNPLHQEKYRDLRNKVIAKIRASQHRYNKKLSDQID